MDKLHPTAIISDNAHLHPSVEVGPYSIIEADTHLAEGCKIESNVKIFSGTTMGKDNRVCHGAVLGCEPQDLTFSPEKSKPLTIGDGNHFREGINISRGVKTDAGTRIGNDNYLMCNAHLGHDCVVGDNNIICPGAAIAGHVTIGDHAFISALVGIHQFTFIGDRTMLAGCAKIVKDIPPFTIGDGNPARVSGINSIGLRRAGMGADVRKQIKRAYHTLYHSGLNVSQGLDALRQTELTPEVEMIIDFFTNSDRGVTTHR